MHRKKYLIVSDSESNIDETKNRKNDVKEESSRTEVEFMDDWIESLRDKWRDFVEDISSTVNNEDKIKETNRTGAEFLDDLFEILSDSWAEYVDEFSGSGDREVGCPAEIIKIYLLYIRKISTLNLMKKTSKSETLTTLILMMVQKTTDYILCLPKLMVIH